MLPTFGRIAMNAHFLLSAALRGVSLAAVAILCLSLSAGVARGGRPRRPCAGQAAMDKDDLEAAIAAFSQAIKLDPKLTAAYVSRGWAYSERDEDEKAIADFSQVIRLDPKDAEAWCNRGLTIASRATSRRPSRS